MRKRMGLSRKWLAMLLSGMMVFSYFFMLIPSEASAAEESLTVAEAIANNHGHATVEGVIIGYATGGGSGGLLVSTTATGDTNLVLADSAEETDTSHMLPVQLTSSYRGAFGLQSNPEHIGKKVRISGSLEPYFGVPGLKNPSAIDFIQEMVDPDLLSIAEVRLLDDGEPAVIAGIVTTTSGSFGSGNVYVQDETAGILIYQNSTVLHPGDIVKVTGTKATYQDEIEIVGTEIELLGTGTVPAPVERTPSSVSEDEYGQLVKLTNVTVSDITDVGAYGSYSFYANDGDDQILVYVDNRTGIPKTAVSEGLVINITGIATPFNGEAQLKPTAIKDIVPVPQDGSGKKVLFDHSHGQTAGAADWVIDGAFSDFADALRADGFIVDALERDIPFDFSEPSITLEKLQPYDVFIIGEPNIPFKTSEQDAMLDYVENGGSIFFIGDHYNADRNYNRWDSTEIFNGYRRGAYGNPTKGMSSEEANSGAMQSVISTDWLGENFGIRFRFNALGDIVSGQIVVPPSESFGITDGITTVESHAGGTLTILDPTIAKGLIYMPENPPAWGPAVDQGVYMGGGIDEGPFAAIAKVGLGKAAFIGDSSPVEDITPKYVREDNGSKKTTYDGFLEADNGSFLIQTVRWLAHQEDYTSFEGVIPLSPVTPLLAFEHPSNTTEPQPEPWTNPSGGYKWYDSTTYAPGSYGSGADAPGEVVIPGIISIADARTYPANTTVTVEGTITSTPGAWGGQGFYLQDATGGIYIFQNSAGYEPGQRVEVTGVVTLYNGELELTDIVEIEVIGTNALPQPLVVSSIDGSNQGQVVKLERVVISDIEEVNQYGTLELYAEDEDTGVRTWVRIDNRTGVTYDSFIAQYTEGDQLDLIGVSSIFNGTYQLKPRWADDIAPAEVGAEEWVTVELIGLNDLHGKIHQYYELIIDGDQVIDGTYGGAEYMAAYVRERQQDNPHTIVANVVWRDGDSAGESILPAYEVIEVEG